MSLPISIIIMLLSGLIGGTVNYLLPSNVDILTKEKIRKWLHCVALGIGATILVPLFLEIAQSKLLDNIHLGYSWQKSAAIKTNPRDSIRTGPLSANAPDSSKDSLTRAGTGKDTRDARPATGASNQDKKEEEIPLKNYFLFTAYCFLAAAAGLRFINNITDSVLKDKQIATLKDQNVEEKKAKEEAEAKKEAAEKEKREAEAKKAIVEKEKERLTMQNKVNLEEAEQSLVAELKPEAFFLSAAADLPSIGEITVPGDPQKGRFGGLREKNGKKISAAVTKSLIPMFYNVTIWVETVDGEKLRGDIIFYLHDTFANPVRVVRENEFKAGKPVVEVKAWGAFTVGVVCDEGKTLLEYDLSENKNFPKEFTER